MRAVLALCSLLAVALCAVGCGESPEDVFDELRTAALDREPRAVWDRLTPASRAALAAEAGRYFENAGPAGEAGGITADSRETYDYLGSLMAGLDTDTVDYIRSLSVAEVELDADTARVRLKTFRYEPPEEPVVFRKLEGKWLWEASDVLERYLRYRERGVYGGM